MSRNIDRAINLLMGFIMGVVGFYGSRLIIGGLEEPKQVYYLQGYSQKDLNRDGIPDLIIELRGGRKIPMYGSKKGNNIEYISTSEMKERNPNSMIDYGKIEKMSNKRK